MDYFDILMRGLSLETKDFMTNFISREMTTAEKEGYTPQEFIYGLWRAFGALKLTEGIQNRRMKDNPDKLGEPRIAFPDHLSQWPKYPVYITSEDLSLIEDAINCTESKIQESAEIQNKNTSDLNPYPGIFPKNEHWEFFEYLKNKMVNYKTELADLSFIFRKMQSDGFIHGYVKPGIFRAWLSDKYKITLEKMKTLGDCINDKKLNIYQDSKILFQVKK